MTAEHPKTNQQREDPDPTRALELLWDVRAAGRRGPRQTLKLRQIVAAATAIVDAEGFDALSMRQVATRLGVGVASLYTYVPSREVLLALILDAAIGEGELPHTYPGTWREKLEAWARADWQDYRNHPWALRLAGVRPLTGPNMLAYLESALSVLADTPLTELEKVAVVESLDGYIRGQAYRASVEDSDARTGEDASVDSWNAAQDSFLEQHADLERYPVFLRAAMAGGFGDAEATFEFGLARLLDGVANLVAQRAGSADGVET